MISMSKKYITRSGIRIKLISTTIRNTCPVIGIAMCKCDGVDKEFVLQWDINGKRAISNTSAALELIEIPDWYNFKKHEPVIAVDFDGILFDGYYAGVYWDDDGLLKHPMVFRIGDNSLNLKIPVPVLNVLLPTSADVTKQKHCDRSDYENDEDFLEWARR